MFSKKNKITGTKPNSAKPVQSVKPAIPSIISSDLVISGDLTSDGEIQVDGNVVGDIKTKSLLIGKTANIKGAIVVDDLRVHGNVNGQIKARTVSLAKTAHVIGDILHENLSIETGAFLEGLCKRMSDTESSDPDKINFIEKPVDNSAPSHSITNNPKKVAS